MVRNMHALRRGRPSSLKPHYVEQQHATCSHPYCVKTKNSQARPREVFDLTISSVDDDEAMLLRLPRLLRLLRVSHAFRYLYRWGELLPVSMYQLRMLKLGFGILLFVHVNASLHLVAGTLNREDPLGWMSRTGALWDSSAHKVRSAHHRHAVHKVQAPTTAMLYIKCMRPLKTNTC